MHRSDILSKIEKHVCHASKINLASYAQESAYVCAFIGRLDGKISFGSGNGEIFLKGTIVNDRGPGAAENIFGADFCLVFESKNIKLETRKGILAQAKKGTIESLTKGELSRLEGQCKKMSEVTKHYCILETPSHQDAIPNIRIGTNENGYWREDKVPFHEYLVDYIIACIHGDKRPSFIAALSDSTLSRLTVKTDGLTFEPDPFSNDPGMGF